ncbi:hypothetical protein AOQ84DRAFT_409564 [Glonium stellatum]|uniref:Uncharacterized protein n=1 Tax=Glonium stellatum TaxID=574774 RepID=A0A8E2JRQ8_9PEZI|nr:hypothetical protein AOQ84DRAFT_409564 [Glonium stellatum]
MTPLPFPLPEVEAALSPYIHSRQETLNIRKKVARYLESQLASADESNSENSRLIVECVPLSLRVKRVPPEINGIRRTYLEALQANVAARERYSGLKSELDELRSQHATDSASRLDVAYDQEATCAYINLLRQRRRFNKLQVIQKTLDKLVDAQPNPGRKDMRTLLKEKLGEQPDLPASKLEPQAPNQEVEDLIFKLKKEVLETKQGMDRANAIRAEAQKQQETVEEPRLEAQVYALRCARNELVSWVEGELAKLSEDESEMLEDQSPQKKLGGVENSESAGCSYQEQIKELYDKYVSSRASLIAAIDSIPTSVQYGPAGSETVESKSSSGLSQGTASTTVKVTGVLPYVPALLQASRDERSLLQQTAYLRHQLASASEETLRTIRRLADESHLVAPGTNSALDWATATKDAAASTKKYVEESLEEGEKHALGAKEVLAEVQARREAFERLKGDS